MIFPNSSQNSCSCLVFSQITPAWYLQNKTKAVALSYYKALSGFPLLMELKPKFFARSQDMTCLSPAPSAALSHSIHAPLSKSHWSVSIMEPYMFAVSQGKNILPLPYPFLNNSSLSYQLQLKNYFVRKKHSVRSQDILYLSLEKHLK